jgi:P27 family predicted phage terminase small subunit
MARPRKPTHLKVISGTFRKSRENPAEPAATGDWPETPAWLSKGAATIFFETCAKMAKLGTLSSEFSDVIAAYASSEDEVITTTAVLEDLGRTYRTTTATGDEMFRPRPEVAMRSDAMRRATTLRSELGLGPSSIAKVSAKPPAGENPFSKLDREFPR